MLLKKLIIESTAATLFGLGTLALANDNLSNLELKNNSATKQFNNKSGFYIRAEGSGGYSDLRIETTMGLYSFDKKLFGKKIVDISSFLTSKSQGFSGRFAIGYDFNAMLGVETGVNFIHSLQKSFIEEGPSNIIFGTVFDLSGKATFPFQNNFYAFAKGGIAYLPTKIITKEPEDGGKTASTSNDYFCPKIALGMGYKISKHVSADISLSRIFGNGNQIFENDHLPSLDFITFAVNYKF